MTQRGAALLVAAVLLWAVGRLLGVSELYVVAVAAGAVVGIAALAVRLASATVSVQRTLATPRLLAGQSGEVRLALRNDARIPAGLLLVEDDCHYGLASGPRFVVPGLSPGGIVQLAYPITGGHRGRYIVGPVRILVRDAFGLTQRVRRFTETAEVLVYPRIEALGEGGTLGAHHGTGASATRRLFASGDEFYTMREYVQGDDLRQVHWRSTARRQTLMVRQQEQPWQAQATIFCDLRRTVHHGSGPDSSLERTVSAAASVLWHLADHGYQLRLVTEADARPARLERWEPLLDRLAEIGASAVKGLAPILQALRRAGAEGLLVAVVAPPLGTDPVGRHVDTRALLHAGRGFSSRMALVVDPGGQAARAAELAALLAAAGWRAGVLPPGGLLAARWPALVSSRRRAVVGARS